MSQGAFCLVLHGHLPWVLHHGRWPHGEDWLFEAVSETWLPLLSVVEQCANEGINASWTVGLMPILLEQLAHDRFKQGFVVWLTEQAERAESDREGFYTDGDGHLGWLAERYGVRFREQLVQFEALNRDIPGAWRTHAEAGRVELLSSNATHAYHPLLLHDACARAQIRAGLDATERHLGIRAQGCWLPECAYRPEGPWTPPAVHGDERQRAGVARLFGEEGVRFFFVDTHLIEGARSEVVLDGDHLVKTDWDQATWDVGRGWRSTMEPHRVAESGTPTALSVLGRSGRVSEQVWSAEHGYPGDGRYLEFHKRHGMRGLRYWKVTGSDVDLGGKHVYHPEDARSAAATNADHFASLVADQIREHRESTGRYGIVAAPFDAELFGHWWAEGPQFLLEVLRRLHHDYPDVELRTVSQALDRSGVDKVVSLPEGTWGAGGDHRVWLHEGLRFYWEVEYRAEDRFMGLWHRVDWRQNARCRELLTEAARQLLLLQASDWPFVITTEGAVDYGMRRILEHAGRFDDLCNGVEDAWGGREPDEVVLAAEQWCKLHDPVFADLDLEWWQ